MFIDSAIVWIMLHTSFYTQYSRFVASGDKRRIYIPINLNGRLLELYVGSIILCTF